MERFVRPDGVVLLQPLFGDLPGLGKSAEEVHVQDVLTEGAIKALDVSILGWLARFDEVKNHFVPFGPALQLL